MLYFDRIDISKRIDINKTSASKECGSFDCWYFLDKGVNFQPDVCNRGHNVLMIYISLSNIAILNINGVDFCCIMNGMSKSGAITLLQNADLTEKSGTL